MLRNSAFILILLALCFSAIGQDSLNMERIGQWNPSSMPVFGGVTYNDVWGYTAEDGSEYAILGNVDSILVIDVTNPSTPERVFGHYGGGHAVWRDFKVHQDYMYAVCDGCNEGMHIFDMGPLPAAPPVHVATIDTFFSKAHNIFIDTATQKLYAAGSPAAFEGLVIIDVSVPDNPVRIENYLFEEAGNFYVHDLYVKNDTAYCSHGTQGYYVWDMTDLDAVDLLGSFDSPGYNHSSWNHSSGMYAYYAEEVPLGRPMAVMDLSNLGSTTDDIEVLHLFRDPISDSAVNVTPHNPFVKNDSLFISYYEDGVKVYDLVDPEEPQLVGYYDTYPDNGSSYTGYEGAWGSYPFFESGNIMISDISYGLNVIRMQNCPSPINYYRDKDGDGFGDSSAAVSSCSEPGGYVLDNTDCDDDDSDVNTSADEICDGIDNDCDGLVDLDDPDLVLTVFYRDADGDGFGDINETTLDCTVPDGYVSNDEDCDDTSNMVNPDFPEVCDGVDNDCDGLVDGLDPDVGNIEWYQDNDGDGYGTSASVLFQCIPPVGYAAFSGDCDDGNANNYPGNEELCDGEDNNCNSQVDENCPEYPCDGIDVYVSSVNQDNYRAKQLLNSDAVADNHEDFAFYAEQEILLMAGFEVAGGSSFLAAIEECEASGNIQADEVVLLLPYLSQLGEADSPESGLTYYVKSENHANSRFFETSSGLKTYIEKLTGSSTAFKVYIFRHGDLIHALDH